MSRPRRPRKYFMLLTPEGLVRNHFNEVALFVSNTHAHGWAREHAIGQYKILPGRMSPTLNDQEQKG